MDGKWFNDPKMDEGVIVSSRIRLARNIAKYPFVLAQSPDTAGCVITDVTDAIKRAGEAFFAQFSYFDMGACSNVVKLSLLNRHAVSPEFLKAKGLAGLFLTQDETLSIMINEEDHLRLQVIYPGDDMDNAWQTIDKTDDLIEETLDYAFDSAFGYLTSCPTNTGTGLRASYMVHIPLLETTGTFRNIAATIGKFGMTVRGIYGEGTEPMGSIYQISNQVAIGKSEDEIITSLKAITTQIIDSENTLLTKMPKQARADMADRIYRAYGALRYCRKISLKEAISLLSDIRLGYTSGVLNEKHPLQNIYAIMMNIQNGLLLHNAGRALTDAEADIARAEYIREKFDS